MVGSFTTVPNFYWSLPETDALLSADAHFPLGPNKPSETCRRTGKGERQETADNSHSRSDQGHGSIPALPVLEEVRTATRWKRCSQFGECDVGERSLG